MNPSAAMTASLDADARLHLARMDGQEDLCFALWSPSRGARRQTALVKELILPQAEERHVHGNASFEPEYFARALGVAMDRGLGLAFIHSHPGGGWQGMSPDDIAAESGHARGVLAATSLPFLGMTLGARDGAWSARLWERDVERRLVRRDCESVRVIGERLSVTFHEGLRRRPAPRPSQARTISAWGPEVHSRLARLRIGVVGLGSVGSIVAEALARTGIQKLVLIDFDSVEEVNLDRILHATPEDARLQRAKVAVAADAAVLSGTCDDFGVETCEHSICEEPGFRGALDCDVLFSCVDRPWARSVLNFIAYAHLIPVIDGGIHVSRVASGRMRGAEWRAHVAGFGRRCLSCLGQFDPGLVAVERDGYLDDRSYIERLPEDHPLRANQNVFAFGLGAAAQELCQLIMMVAAPAGVSSYGAQTYHLVTGSTDLDTRDCEPTCPYPALSAGGDLTGLVVTGHHLAAEQARASRGAGGSNPP